MNLSEPFIRRPVMTAVLTASVVLFGVLSYRQLPVNDLPAVDYPVIQVQADYPGASPDTMANNIATPLERQFMQITGLEIVTSKSTQGHVSLTLQFSLDKSIDAAATDVQTAITQATGSLPIDLPSPPTLSKTNPNDQPIMYVALTSDSITAGQLYDYGNIQIGQRISILPGVSRVAVFGAKTAIRIKADPGAMWARGHLDRRPVGGHPRRHQLFRRRPARLVLGHRAPPAPRAARQRRGLQEPRSWPRATARPCTCATSPTSGSRSRTSASTMHFWARGYTVPSAIVVAGRLPAGGRQRREGGPEHPRPGAGDHGRASGRGAHHARCTTARRPS